MAILTGAHSDGCGGSSDGDGQGGSDPRCAVGSHPEMFCADDQSECIEECVPDDECPPDTIPEWICQDMPHPGGDDCGGECFLTCTPIDPCGPDMHEEWVCEDLPQPMHEPYCDGPDCMSPPPPEQCYPICVPNGCPEGQVEVVICEDGPTDPDEPSQPNILPSQPPDPIDECFVTCMDEGQPPPDPGPEPEPFGG